MDLCFAILTLACAVFGVQIFMQYTRQTQALRPRIRHLEEETKGQVSEKEKYLKMADETRARIAGLDAQIQELEGERLRHEKALQARLSEDGEGSPKAPEKGESRP
jgi:chromosome segregation ATPase